MAATDDSTPHLFDVATQKAFLPVHSAAPHTGAIACVRYAPGGSYYATCGRDDGTIKVWDGATGACVRTVDKAHGGGAVYSVQVLLGSQLLLSMGHDGKPRLWDISSGAQVMEFVGRSGECSTGTQAAMSWNEELVVSADERPCGLMVWCARTGKLLERVSTYNSLVRGIACSPVEDAVLSCGQDARARFWTASAE